MKKLKDLITKKYKFWYIIFSTSGVLMLLNTEILSEFIPFWATCIINSVILVADVLYAKVLVVHLKEKTFKYVNKKQVEIQKFVQEKITEAENSINANIEKEAITIISSINVNAGEIKNNVNKNSLSLEESINKLKEIENEHNSLVCVRIEESSKKNEQILKISTDLLNDKIAELDNNEANRRDEARGELKQIIKSVEQSLIETDKENLEELKSEVVKINTEIKKNLEDMSITNEENKTQVESILKEISRVTNNKLLEMNEGITNRITEYSEQLKNSFEILETSDGEREGRLKEELENLKQTVSSVENNLQQINNDNLEELKSEVGKANVEIKKTLGDMSTSNEENKEQVENILQEMSVATNNKLLEMNEGITNRITEYSEQLKNSFEILETSDGEREGRLKEELENLKQTVSSVENNLQQINNDNLEELKSEVGKANVEIKKTLGDMSTSNEENKEQVENILQEMSVATNNKLLEMNEGITSRITEYSDKLNNSLETLETSDIERENRIKEIIQKVSDEQIKKIANKLEVLFEEQSDNVNTIIDTVNASIVQFNEELVKQSNAIQDLNDENTNFVTEKYNRVFEQIRVFSKDSKATLKNVKLAIDNNKDSIEKSEKKITNYIENYFNTIDDKAKEIDSLKNIVKRNYDIFNEQLEFTHNQLDSLNSLASIIKKMAEKPEKSEKVEEKKSDRVELIKDSDTGLDVKNTYKNNMLKQSSMFKGRRKVYDVEYGQKGEILKTKNYDQKGNLSIEMAYYANGQVKERREYISGRAEISKFDINGKKIN